MFMWALAFANYKVLPTVASDEKMFCLIYWLFPSLNLISCSYPQTYLKFRQTHLLGLIYYINSQPYRGSERSIHDALGDLSFPLHFKYPSKFRTPYEKFIRSPRSAPQILVFLYVIN